MFIQKENFGESSFRQAPFRGIKTEPVGIKPMPYREGRRGRSPLKDRIISRRKPIRVNPEEIESIQQLEGKKKKVKDKKIELQEAIKEEEKENEDFPFKFREEIQRMMPGSRFKKRMGKIMRRFR
jgi:hypothetical protein